MDADTLAARTDRLKTTNGRNIIIIISIGERNGNARIDANTTTRVARGDSGHFQTFSGGRVRNAATFDRDDG